MSAKGAPRAAGRPSELGPDPVTIRVRVSRELAERIGALAGGEGRSSVVRMLIERGLGKRKTKA